MGGIYSPHTPQKGSRHIARRKEWRNFGDFGSRDMAGAFSGGSGGIDTPRAPVTKVSVTSSPTNQNSKVFQAENFMNFLEKKLKKSKEI